MKSNLIEKKYHLAVVLLLVLVLIAISLSRFSHHTAKAQSTPTLNWTEAYTMPFPWQTMTPVEFNNKLWVMGGYQEKMGYASGGSPDNGTDSVWSSPDGTNWTETVASAPWVGRLGVTPVVFDNKLWVIGGYGGAGGPVYNDVWSSSDGVTWTEATANAGFPVGSAYWESASAFVFDGKLWVMGIEENESAYVYSSSDGVTWTAVTQSGAPSGLGISGVAPVVYGGKLWIDNNYADGPIYSSSDGATWTETGSSGEPGQLVAFNSELEVIGTDPYASSSDVTYSSTDGINWTKVSTNVNPSFVGSVFVFNNELNAFGGENSEGGGVFDYGPIYLYSSPDGVNWTEGSVVPPWPARFDASSLVFNNQIWIMGGANNTTSYNDVWSSSDGTNWTEATAGASWVGRYGASSLTFNNQMWIMGGVSGELGNTKYNDVWSSSDGTNWTEATGNAPWAAREGASAVVFDNKMWIMGGANDISGDTSYNDVWSSSDGVSWTEATGNAPWAAREGASAVVFDNKMWIMGGASGSYPSNTDYNDVWSSSDGVSWTEVTGTAAWAARYGASALTYNNQMLVTGGNYFMGGWNIFYNDAWTSSDGVNWTEVTSNAPWPARVAASSLFFNDQVWIMGGDSNTGYNDGSYDDVWSAAIPPAVTVTGVNVTCPSSVYTNSTSTCSVSVSGTGSYGQGVTWSASTGSIDASGNYTAPDSTGTDTVTACSSQSGYSSVCGSSSVTVSIPTSSPPPTATISASTSTLTLGSSTTLTWGSTNATSCTASGAWSGTEATSGSMAETPIATGTLTYGITCTGVEGSAPASTTVTVSTATTPASTTVTVVNVTCNPSDTYTNNTSTCTATVSGTGSYGQGVTWSANTGSIDNNGNYTAPGSTGTATVTACSSQSGYTNICGPANIIVDTPSCTPLNFDVATTWIPQAATGILDSQTFDTGVASGAQLNSITWRGSLPSSETSVGFEIAVSNSSSGPWNFIGPDGMPGPPFYSGIAGMPITLGNYSSLAGRYFRYRVILTTNVAQTLSPSVNNVVVNWSP